MKFIKVSSLLLFIGLFSISCSENNFSPTQPKTGRDSVIGEKTSKTSTQGSTSIRYDDLPDLAEFVVDGRRRTGGLIDQLVL